MYRQLLGALAALATFGLVLFGCGGATPRKGERLADVIKDAPEWVTKACLAFSGEKRDRICAVGEISGTDNLSLCRSAAADRGRTEIARQLQVKVANLVKDYQGTVTGGAMFGKAASDEQLVSDTAKQVAAGTLAGSRPEDLWISPQGHCFVLVALDPATFSRSLASMQGLDESVRKYVMEHADRAFNDLDQAMQGTPVAPGGAASSPPGQR